MRASRDYFRVRQYYVYVLYIGDAYYTGYTDDLARRIQDHIRRLHTGILVMRVDCFEHEAMARTHEKKLINQYREDGYPMLNNERLY
jgi:predicted GIY-YIG superfamily endonuclease